MVLVTFKYQSIRMIIYISKNGKIAVENPQRSPEGGSAK